MARRWQLSLWVLAGLVLSVVALWDSATVSAVADRVAERTETVDRAAGADADSPAGSDLAFSDLGGTGSVDGGANVLRPTTTTTTRPTTTTSTAAVEESIGVDGERAPGSAATTPVDGNDDPTAATNTAGPSSTTPNGPSTTAPANPALTTVYDEDFADGELVDGRWAIANSVGRGGWGFLRPSAVTVVPDPSATGGHVLAVTARMGTGSEAGRVVSGALRLVGYHQSSGRYSVRARVDADPDGATAGVVLLRPASTGEPAESASDEIRMMETSGNRTTRTPVESSARWTAAEGTASVRKAHRTAAGAVSASDWHVYTLEWTADQVTVLVDGVPLSLIADPAHAPRGPMDLTIRLDPLDSPTAPGEQPVLSGEVRLLVDWIRIEGYTGESSP